MALGLAVSPTFAASEKKIEISKSNENQLRENFQKLKIDKKTQEKLIDKIKNGQVLDSENPNELAKVPEEALTPTLNDPVKRYTFPDGSVIENGIEIISKTELDKDGNILHEYHKKNSGEIGILSDEEIIKSTCGSGYCNYTLRVYHNRGAVYAEFLAAISLVKNGPDTISDVGDYDITCLYGYSTGEDLRIDRGKELEGIAPAAATLSFTWVNVGSTTMRLRLNVEDDSFYSSANW
jgi:hypothetical protein